MKTVVFFYNQTSVGLVRHARAVEAIVVVLCFMYVCVCVVLKRVCVHVCVCVCTRTCAPAGATQLQYKCEDVYMLISIVPPMRLGKCPEILKELSLSPSLSLFLSPSLSPPL